jgi:hypothetical protein
MINVKEALDKFGFRLLDRIRQRLLTQNRPGGFPIPASGTLVNSLKHEVSESGNTTTLTAKAEDYYKFVDKGRRPGKFPPVDAIRKWVEVKPIRWISATGRPLTVQSMGFLIGRKIAREGIKPTNIFTEETDKIKREIEQELPQFLSPIISKELSKLIRNG